MPANSNLRTTNRSKGASSGRTVVLLATLAIIALGSYTTRIGVAFASEEGLLDAKALATANAMALPDTYLFTLSLEENGKAVEFSTMTAMRHFSLEPAEKRIRFRGRLWLQPDGRELLDFSVDFGQQIEQPDGSSAVSREGHWSGSAYVESGKPIRMVTSPNSQITATLRKQ